LYRIYTDIMRKVTVVVKINILSKFGLNNFLADIKSLSLVEFIRFDSNRLIEVAILEIHLKKNKKFKDVRIPPFARIPQVFSETKDRVVFLYEAKYPQFAKPLFKKMDVDIIWERPFKITKDYAIVSGVGTEANLKKFVKAARVFGSVERISYSKADYKGHNELDKLTTRQKEVLKAAKKYGYYRYPREISTEELAKKIKCSKATLIEHLRRIENKLITSILEKNEM